MEGCELSCNLGGALQFQLSSSISTFVIFDFFISQQHLDSFNNIHFTVGKNKMADSTTPEQAAQHTEKYEQEVKDRYSSEDKSYPQITGQPELFDRSHPWSQPRTQPPPLEIRSNGAVMWMSPYLHDQELVMSELKRNHPSLLAAFNKPMQQAMQQQHHSNHGRHVPMPEKGTVKALHQAKDQETPYDIEKVLLELGEVDSKKKAKGKKAKIEQKGRKNNTKNEIIASNCEATKESTPASSERSSGNIDQTKVKQKRSKNKSKKEIFTNSSNEDVTREKIPASSEKSSRDRDPEDEVKTNSKTEISLLSSTVENIKINESKAMVDNECLGAESLPLQAMETKKTVFDEGNINIPVEFLEYVENIEEENKNYKKISIRYIEKLMDSFEVQKDQIQSLEEEKKIMEKDKQKLEKEKKNSMDARMCIICCEKEICYVFIPCGHQNTCENCAMKSDLKDCPVCRQRIKNRFKIYLP